jgi:hypothetical protein
MIRSYYYVSLIVCWTWKILKNGNCSPKLEVYLDVENLRDLMATTTQHEAADLFLDFPAEILASRYKAY